MPTNPWDVPPTDEGRETLLALADEYRAAGRPRELGICLARLAHVVKHAGTRDDEPAFDAAARYGREAVELLRQAGDQRELAIALRAAALPFVTGVDHTTLLTESLALARSIGDKEQEGWTLYRMTKAQGVAGVSVEDALACFESCGCLEGQAACLLSLAIASTPWSLEKLNRAVELYEQSGHAKEADMARRYVEVATSK